MGNIIVKEEAIDILDEYSKLSIEFEVESEYRIRLIDSGLGGVILEEEKVDSYRKNYDTIDHNPSLLPQRFNLDNWQVILAYDNDKIVGGAIIAYNTISINMLEGRDDIAVLWDIRVDKEYRGKGVGKRIIEACVNWARKKKCSRLKIETQNNNVKACKFYAKQGAKLTDISQFAYEDYPMEVQLIWNIFIGD